MAPSVSFADQLVTDCYEVPRLSEDNIPDYFYSHEDITHFKSVWKAIIMQRMRQFESKRLAREGDHDTECHQIAKRRRCLGNEKSEIVVKKQEMVQVVRSVSPVEQEAYCS